MHPLAWKVRVLSAAAVGLVVVCAAAEASARPVLVQGNWGQHDGAGNVTCKWNRNINTGDLLIATVTYTGGSGTTITPPGTNGGSRAWIEIPTGHADQSTNIGVRIYYSLNSVANTTKPTETWTVSPSSAEVVLELHEVSGVLTSGALDASAVAVGTTTPPNFNASTSSSASEMTFAVFGVRNATANPGTPQNGSVNYSNINSAGTSPLGNTQIPNSGTTRTRSSYILVTSTSGNSVNAKLNALPAGTTNWAAAVVTFQLTSVYWIGAGSYPARPGTPDPATCYGFFDDDGCWSSTSGGTNNVAGPGSTDVVVFDGGGVGDVTFSPFVAGTEAAYSIEVKATYVGTLNMSDQAGVSPDLSLTGAFLQLGGTFNVNAGQLQVGGATTLNGSGAIFNGASGTETLNAALTVTAGTMSLGPSPTLTGNTQVGTSGSSATNGSLTLGSGAMTFPGTIIVTGTSSVLNLGTGNVTFNNNVTIDWGGTLNMGASGTKTFSTRLFLGTTGNSPTGALTFPGGSTANVAFNSATAPSVRMQGGATFDASGGGTITFGGGASAGTSALTITSGTMNLSGATASIAAGDVTLTAGSLTLGTNGGGAFIFPGNFTANATFDANTNTAGVTVNGNLTVNGGTFHAKSTNLDVKGTTTMQNAFSFDSVAAQVTFENNVSTSGTGTLDLHLTTPSITSGTVSIGGTSTLILGAQPLTFPSDVSVAGTFTSGTGALTFQGAITNSNGSLNLTNPSALTFSSSLFAVSGGATTFGSQTVTIPGAVQVSGGGTMTFGSGTTQLQSTLSLANGGSAISFGSGITTIQNAVTMSAGTFNGGSGTLTAQSTIGQTGGTFNAGSGTMNALSTITQTGGTFNCATSTLTVTGATAVSGGATFNAPTVNNALTFNGPVTLGGADGTRAVFNINRGRVHFAFATTAMSPNSLLLQGGIATSRTQINTATASGGATINFGENAAAGTNAINMTSVAPGTDSVLVDLSDVGTVTFGAGQVSVGSGHTITMNANTGALTFPETVTVAGTFTGSSNSITFGGPLSVSGTLSGGGGSRTFNGAVTSSGTVNVTAASSLSWGPSSSLTVSGGTTTFGAYSNALVTVPAVSVTGGTFDATNGGTGNGTRLTVSGATSVSGMGVANLATRNIITLSGAVTISGAGSLTLGTQSESLGSTLDVSGTAASFTAGTGSVTIAGTVTVGTGGTVTLGSGTEALQGILNVPGGTFTVGSGAATVTGPTTVTASGVINGGSSGNLRFTNAFTLGTVAPGSAGTFNGGSSTATFSNGVTIQGASTFNAGSGSMTYNGVLQLLGSSFLNGNTAAGTFNATPTLSSGTFTVGDTGTTKVWTYAVAAGTMTVSSGVTVAFPTSGGELSFKNGNALSFDGRMTSSAGAIAARPKIDCNGCVGGSGFTVDITSGAVLNVDGLTFDHVSSSGVRIASGATYTLFKNVRFTNNAANGTGGTHLAMTLGTGVVIAPGCFFDSTASTNVTLNGTSGQPNGARAIFEYQGAATNGAGAGESLDADGDNLPSDPNPDNGLGQNLGSPYFGSVVQWDKAAPVDTTGTAVGFPSQAFDWNTFAYYGIYVAYKDASGSTDRVWVRNNDGSPAYFYDIADTGGTVGDIVGTPRWDTVNEVTAGLDVNGDGDSADTDLHVVYIATSLGHVIKLIDTGTGFAVPGTAPWNTDFTSANVTTITSPLIADANNLYFGGTDGGATKIFAVQIASGAGQKTLVRNIATVSAINTAPSWKVYSGSTYLFVGSTLSGGSAYVYRINITSNVVDASFSGATASINDAIRLIADKAYAITDGGTMHVLNAANFGTGGFTNLSGFPYQTAAASPIKSSPYIDAAAGNAYFGDNAGNLYVVNGSGTAVTGYPFSISGTPQLTSTPAYLSGGGVIALGASDGFLYFIDRHNGSNSPSIFKRYLISSGGSVSSVAYSFATSQYMVSSSDGKLAFINGSDVTDPTSATE